MDICVIYLCIELSRPASSLLGVHRSFALNPRAEVLPSVAGVDSLLHQIVHFCCSSLPWSVCKILVLLPVDFWWIATVFWVEMKISTAQLSGKKAHQRGNIGPLGRRSLRTFTVWWIPIAPWDDERSIIKTHSKNGLCWDLLGGAVGVMNCELDNYGRLW